jgi:UDP-N-acetylglucosamine 4-epimerase
MNYLITGGAGFIGSNIAERLLGKGERVRILDNFSTGRRENLSFAPRGSIEMMEGDIRRLHDCRKAVEGIDFILHHAALASVARSVKDPLLNHDINVTGTVNMLIAARDAGVQRFVLASSSSVYGDGGPDDPSGSCPARAENMQPAPPSPYALSKLIGEQHCRLFSDLYGLETIVLRYFNVFGRRQDPRSEYAAVIPKFIESVLTGQKPVIYGDGLQSRDFIHIDDVVEANLRACRAPKSAIGGPYNIARGRSCNLLDILDSLRQLVGTPIDPVFAPAKPGDIRHSLADISRAGEILGFEPKTTFREGLKKTLEWYRERMEKDPPPANVKRLWIYGRNFEGSCARGGRVNRERR